MDILQSIRVFLKVANLGSFSRAAEAMGISKAVVTRRVADLEARLGTRLMNRTTRVLSLTESGQVYLERTSQVLDELESVEQMVFARNHEPVGTLRIVAPLVFGLHNLAPVLQTYIGLHPQVVPDLTLVDRDVDLVEEGFDVGIVIAQKVRSLSIVTRGLTTGCMVACAAPAYLEKHGVPTRPEQLAEHAFLSLPSDYWGEEHSFIGPEGEIRARPWNVIVCNNTELLRQSALRAMGIAILPSFVIGNDAMDGNLVRVLADYRLPMVEVNVCYPSRRHLPAKVRTFIDHLVEHFSKIPHGALGKLSDHDSAVLPIAPQVGVGAKPKDRLNNV